MSTVAESVLDRVFEPLGRCLTPAAARKLVALRADPFVQTHIDELASKSNEGQLTEDERSEYEAYVRAIQFVTVLQSKARSLLAKQT
jgi:hypothetical protein